MLNKLLGLALRQLPAALLGLGLTTTAAAQDLGAGYYSQAMTGLITNQLNITQVGVNRNLSKGVRAARPAGKAAPALADDPRLRFQSTVARRRADYASFVAKSRRADPAGATSLAATLRQDPVAALVPELAKTGLRIDNVADAYAVYWVEAWETTHGTTGTTSRAQAQAVRAQAAAALLATPSYLSSTEAQRQQLADALLVQALLIGASREQNKDNSAMLRQVAAAVRQGAQASGLDLDGMQLTGQGFVAKP
ncbi:MAG: DUF6683 family protein [Janthinobacterium lividum]